MLLFGFIVGDVDEDLEMKVGSLLLGLVRVLCWIGCSVWVSSVIRLFWVVKVWGLVYIIVV